MPTLIETMIATDLGALAELKMDNGKVAVEKLVAEIMESGKFVPAPEEPIGDDDLVIGEMTSRQKALFNIFQNEENDMGIRECAYDMIQSDIREDPRIIEKKDSVKTGMGMCVGYMIVLY